MREKPGFPAHSRVSGGAWLNAGVTGWRRSADRARLHAISLLSGNLIGNFAYFEHPRDVSGAKTAVPLALLKQFPASTNRENYSRIREISRRNREFYPQNAKRKRPFLAHLFPPAAAAICSHPQICR
jgi:hypothetical protein